jgi:hypothetical protein
MMASNAWRRRASFVLLAACMTAWFASSASGRRDIPPPPPMPAEEARSAPAAPPPPAESTVPGKCTTCGVIRSIREVTREKKPRDLPGYAASPQYLESRSYSPATVGPVLGFSFGPGSQSTPYVGAVGSPQMRAQMQETVFEVIVRFDDGRYGLYELTDPSSFRIGDRVRVEDNELKPMPR